MMDTTIVASVIGGSVVLGLALLGFAVRFGKLTEQVSRMERDSRERWADWNRVYRDRCSYVERRFYRVERRLSGSRGVAGGDAD